MALPVMSPTPTNTYLQPQANSVREDLADVVFQIDPEETPFVSMLSDVNASQILTEWLFQKLNVAANVPQPEGFTAAISPAKKPARLSNVCQILARTVGVSDTLRVVDNVGDEEYNRQLVMRGIELRRDLELTMTGESVKTITDPRAMSGFQTWCNNGSVGAGTGVLPLGDGTTAHTVGTLRDLTLDIVESAVQDAWNDGGSPSVALMSGNIKRYFSQLPVAGTGNQVAASQVVQHTSPSPVTIMGSVAAFLTDFGTIQLVPDRFMPAHVIELIDTRYVENAPLPGRMFVEEQYAKTGDSTAGGVVYEGTLRVTAPEAHACVWDLNQ